MAELRRQITYDTIVKFRPFEFLGGTLKTLHHPSAHLPAEKCTPFAAAHPHTDQAAGVPVQALGCCCGAVEVKVIISRALQMYRTARKPITTALARICRVCCRRLHCLARLHVPLSAGRPRSALRVPLLLMQAAEFRLPGLKLQRENDYRNRRATGAIFFAFGRRSARLARESRWAV